MVCSTAELDPAQRYKALIETARAAAQGHHADPARACHDAMVIVKVAFGPDHNMVATSPMHSRDPQSRKAISHS